MSRRSILSMAPMIAITMLYFFVAFSWLKKIAITLDESGVSSLGGENGFIALHAVSSAIFYFVVGAITVVRLEPLWRQRRLIGWILPSLVVASMTLVGTGKTNELPYGMTVVSAMIVLIGTCFTLYSLRHLGRNFGVISDVRGLVTSGPYRWVRHPLYAGETLTMVGLLLAVINPLTVAAFVIGTALQLWRMKVEEQALAGVFPEYREYAARTPMLIPFTKLSVGVVGRAQTAE